MKGRVEWRAKPRLTFHEVSLTRLVYSVRGQHSFDTLCRGLRTRAGQRAQKSPKQEGRGIVGGGMIERGERPCTERMGPFLHHG